MKSLVKNCPTHGLTTWMIIQTFYAGLNFSSRNLLDSAAGETFMSLTLGASTKLLDNMMINYSEWHTERAPQGKKVNSVEETSSLNDKMDAIISMLGSSKTQVDPNNIPLASLVAQEEHVDENFIRNNNFNNNAYRNNFGNNNYKPYTSNNGNTYSNSYGSSYSNNRSAPSELEVMLKDFITKQTAFNKTIEEKFSRIDVLAAKVDSLALDVDLIKLKVMPTDFKESKTLNAIQVRIDENVRMMAELHAMWEREDEIARNKEITKVCTITTTSSAETPIVSKPPNKIFSKEKASTSPKNLPKTTELNSDSGAEISGKVGDHSPLVFDNNEFDFNHCTISEVIKYLCDLGASISVMPKKVYDMLDLPPVKNCYLDVVPPDISKKKPLGRVDDVLIIVNNNLVRVDFVVLDIECNSSCPIVLGRPFLRTVGATIDMKEGTIKYSFPLKKGVEHFPRKKKKVGYDSIIRANYDVDTASFENI